jgi:hypothetical protein
VDSKESLDGNVIMIITKGLQANIGFFRLHVCWSTHLFRARPAASLLPVGLKYVSFITNVASIAIYNPQ